MRLSKRKHGNALHVNMTPMIDIVFLLIVFFMTVSQISESSKERLQLPQLEGSQDLQPATLTVNINRAGDILVSRGKVTTIDLKNVVQGELSKLGGDVSLLTIILRADELGSCRVVNDVVEMLDSLQIQRIRIAVQVPG